MRPVVVIGDEVTCAGFRLAGAEVIVSGAADAAGAVERMLGTAQLLMLTAPVAAALAPPALRALLARETPLVVVLPALPQPDVMPDEGRRIRVLLGIEA